MPDLTTILKQDHRRLDSMLDELADAGESEQEELIDEIERAFELHAHLEEQYVYPHVEDDLGDEEYEEANAEHELARQGMDMLRAHLGQPGFGAVVEMVKAGIEHHVQEEEREVLPQLKRSMDRDEWRQLSDEVAEHHEEAEGDGNGSGGNGGSRARGRSTGRTRSSNGRFTGSTGSAGNGRSTGRSSNGSGRTSSSSPRSGGRSGGSGSRSGSGGSRRSGR